MRIGIVVDSACDLPQAFIQENKITILPISLHLDGRQMIDVRDPETTLDFYRQHVTAASQAETTAFSIEQTKNLFLEKLVIDYDLVFVFTIASSRSPMFENVTQASYAILNEYRPIRARAGLNSPFTIRVVDTQTCFAAQAVPVVECVRMIKAGENHNRIRERLDQLVLNNHGYMFPRDLKQLRARAQKRGDRSVGMLQYLVGSALDMKPLIRGYRNVTAPVARLRHFDDGIVKCFGYVESRIRAGLLSPHLVMSYGGEVSEIEKLPGFSSLLRCARQHDVEMLLSTMSMVGGIHVGEGAVAFGFASPEHELPF